MARVPILQNRVSPRAAADPGLDIPDQSAYLGGVAEAAEGLRQRIGQISLAEQREKENAAKTGLATDLNQFLMEAKQDEDPDSLPGRFDAFLKEKVETYSQGLRPDFAQQFKQTAQLAGQDYQVKVGNISADARSDRLLANANGELRKIVDAFATSDDPEVRDQLAVNGVMTLDNLLANGVIDRVKHDQLSNAFAADSLNGLAGRILAQDPRALLEIDQQEEFAGMDQSDRLKWQAAAKTKVERIEREAEQKRKTQEREYLAGFDATVEAMGRGAPLTDSAIARVSDTMIDANIRDADLREALKDQRDIAVEMHRDVTDIPSMTPEAMLARRQEVAADLENPVATPEAMAVFGIQQDRLSNIDKAIQQVMTARSRDGAGTARSTSTVVQGAFDAFQQEPSQENFTAYKAALNQAYDDQGYLPSQRTLLPAASAQSMVDSINTEAVSSPETAAQLIADLATASGEDWSRVQGELQDAGLSEDMAAVGFLIASPRMQNKVVGIVQAGGMKVLKEQVPKADRDSVDDEIATAFEQPFRLAGGRNTGFIRSMAQSAKLLAYSLVSEGKSVGDAVDDAVAAVMAKNFQPVEEPRIRGLVDAGVTIDPRVVGAGASAWFEQTLAAPKEVPALPGKPVIVEDKGKFYAVPTVIDGNDVQPIAAEHQARMNKFVGLPSFGSRAEAEAALAGSSRLEAALNLTPQEKNIVEYHRRTIADGKTGRDEQGRPVTVYSTGIKIPAGPNKGKFVSVPGFVNGKIVKSDGDLFEHWKEDINAGKWPLYDSGAELNRRSQEIHQIMDAESGDVGFAIDPVQANAFRINTGMRDGDVQDIARMVLENSGRFEIAPDGKSAVLVEDAPGTAQAIRDPQGNPITVPISVLEKLGRERLGRIEREKNMGGAVSQIKPDTPDRAIPNAGPSQGFLDIVRSALDEDEQSSEKTPKEGSPGTQAREFFEGFDTAALVRREGSGDSLTDVPTGLGGLQKANKAQMEKEAGRKLKDEEAIALFVKKGIKRLQGSINNWDKAPKPVRDAIIDAGYNLGWGAVEKFSGMQGAMKSSDWEGAALNLLDTANVGGKSVRGIARRRAEWYNKVAKKPIDYVEQMPDGTLKYVASDGEVIFSYKPRGGRHPDSRVGKLDVFAPDPPSRSIN